MISEIEKFWSSVKTVFRISTMLCIVAGIIAVNVTAYKYNTRSLQDSALVTKFYDTVDTNKDYQTCMAIGAFSVLFIFIGWEAIHQRNILFLHVSAWGMLILAIIMFVYTCSRYCSEHFEIARDLAKNIHLVFDDAHKITYSARHWITHKYGWMGNINSLPRMKDLEIVQKALGCCGRLIREADYAARYNTYHGRLESLPFTCCKDGFYRRRCKFGENYTKGCPEVMMIMYKNIIVTCRIVLFFYTLILLFCALWGISCVVYLHSFGYQVKLKTIRESFTLRARRRFGVKESDRKYKYDKDGKLVAVDDSDDDSDDSSDDSDDEETEKKPQDKKKNETPTKKPDAAPVQYGSKKKKKDEDYDDDYDDEDDDYHRQKFKGHHGPDKKHKKRNRDRDDDEREFKRQRRPSRFDKHKQERKEERERERERDRDRPEDSSRRGRKSRSRSRSWSRSRD